MVTIDNSSLARCQTTQKLQYIQVFKQTKHQNVVKAFKLKVEGNTSTITPYTSTSFKKSEKELTRAPENTYPIVILPGFGNNTQDYINPYGVQEQGLKSNLEKRGFQVFVVPVNRGDWVKVFRMLLDLKYFRSQCQIDPGYRWYLDRVNHTIQKAQEASGFEKVHLVGHSAGGWLGRAYIGDQKYQNMDLKQNQKSANNDLHKQNRSSTSNSNLQQNVISNGKVKDKPESQKNVDQLEEGFDIVTKVSQSKGSQINEQLEDLSLNPRVASIVTLGSPQGTGEKQTDRTGGTLRFVNQQFPGAYFKLKGINYVCVSGRSIKGLKKSQRNTQPRQSYNSYLEVCGDGEVEGDGVVPCQSATLQGATNIILEGVTHSMLQSGFKETTEYAWYGSDSVVDLWLKHLIEQDS